MGKGIAAVVVTYNRKEYLLRNIPALLAQEGGAPAILVIDNAGTDGTEQAVQPYVSAGTVQYYNTGENLGGAGGFAYGMEKAVQAGYDYLWIMDDDCIPDPGALNALRQADRELDGQYGFLSGIAYWKDGSPCNMNRQRVSLNGKLEDYETPLVPVIMATFVSAFFPAQRVVECGLPIREFFIWADDLEYTRRLSRRYPCYAVNGSRALHDMKSNDKVNIATDAADRLPRYRYLYRNEVYVYRREGLKGWLYLLARVVLHTLRALKAPNRRRERASTVLASFFAGLRFHPPVRYVAEVKEEGTL